LEKGKGGLPTMHDSRPIRIGLLEVERAVLSICGFKSPVFAAYKLIFNMQGCDVLINTLSYE
jgi:hypothetical protein